MNVNKTALVINISMIFFLKSQIFLKQTIKYFSSGSSMYPVHDWVPYIICYFNYLTAHITFIMTKSD